MKRFKLSEEKKTAIAALVCAIGMIVFELGERVGAFLAH